MDIATLLDLYARYRTPRKSARERRADARRSEMWTRVLGAERDPADICLRDWEWFHDARLSGAIDARGRHVAGDAAHRRLVGPRTVEADLKWLKWVLNWATKWRTETGYLLAENPVRGFEIPVEKNPRRPVASQGRYKAIRAVSDGVLVRVSRGDDVETVRSDLSEIIDLANGTGRRLSAICALRYEDLRLGAGPHGAICWPAATDKQGKASLVPISPLVRAAIDRVLAERPGAGAAYLFPSPTDPAKPVSRHLADKWLRRAERLAGLEPQRGSLWHAYRRNTDVAAAGGWAGPETMQRAYQHADQATMLAVVLDRRELWDVE